MTDPVVPVPGMVIDTDDVDAKLIVLKVRGAPHLTGGDMDLIARRYGKDMSELTPAEGQVAIAYIYLRRAGVEGASWEMAADSVAVEVAERLDPSRRGSSTTSSPSADSGLAPPGISTP